MEQLKTNINYYSKSNLAIGYIALPNTSSSRLIFKEVLPQALTNYKKYLIDSVGFLIKYQNIIYLITTYDTIFNNLNIGNPFIQFYLNDVSYYFLLIGFFKYKLNIAVAVFLPNDPRNSTPFPSDLIFLNFLNDIPTSVNFNAEFNIATNNLNSNSVTIQSTSVANFFYNYTIMNMQYIMLGDTDVGGCGSYGSPVFYFDNSSKLFNVIGVIGLKDESYTYALSCKFLSVAIFNNIISQFNTFLIPYGGNPGLIKVKDIITYLSTENFLNYIEFPFFTDFLLKWFSNSLLNPNGLNIYNPVLFLNLIQTFNITFRNIVNFQYNFDINLSSEYYNNSFYVCVLTKVIYTNQYLPGKPVTTILVTENNPNTIYDLIFFGDPTALVQLFYTVYNNATNTFTTNNVISFTPIQGIKSLYF